jgi:WD40 repeat protein
MRHLPFSKCKVMERLIKRLAYLAIFCILTTVFIVSCRNNNLSTVIPSTPTMPSTPMLKWIHSATPDLATVTPYSSPTRITRGIDEIPTDICGGYLVAFSPTSRQLATMPGLLEMVYFDLETDKLIWDLEIPSSERGVNGKSIIEFSPQGDYIASGGDDLRLDIFEVSTGVIRWKILTDKIFPTNYSMKQVAPISDVSFLQDGKHIILSSHAPRGGLAFINLEAGESYSIFSGRVNDFDLIPGTSNVVFSTGPVGAKLKSDTSVVIFDYEKMKIVESIFPELSTSDKSSSYPSNAESVSFSGKYIAAIIDDQLRIWDYDQHKEIQIPIPSDQFKFFTQVLFTPDGSRMITLSNGPCRRLHWAPLTDFNCELSIWEVGTWSIIGSEPVGEVISMDVSKDSEMLVTGSFNGIRLWAIP